MRKKCVYIWSAVQITIGLLLLAGTTYMTFFVLPGIRSHAGQIGCKVAKTAETLREVNITYCESATNLFSITESLYDVAGKLGDIGRKVVKTGGKLHFDISLLDKLNVAGDNISDVGNDIINVARAIRKQGDALEEYKSAGHMKTSASIIDASVILVDISEILKDVRTIDGYFWYLGALGGVVSLLFIMNGVILVSTAKVYSNFTSEPYA